MRTSRIFVDQPINQGSLIDLPDDKAHYVKHVLRLKLGQQLILFNGRDASDYLATLESCAKKVSARIISVSQKRNESALHLTLVQAVGKVEHMDLVTQKATELGVTEIHFFNSERTQSPLKQARLQKKLAHWKAIAQSACEQCGRNHVPTISFHPDLSVCLDALTPAQRLMLAIHGQNFGDLSQSYNAETPFQLLVGSEGGLTDREIEQAHAAGFTGFQLGPRTLRMETAATSITALIQHHFGDLR